MSLCPKVKIFTVAIKLKEQAHTLSNVGAAVDRDFVFKHLWFCRKMLQLLFIEQLQKSFCGWRNITRLERIATESFIFGWTAPLRQILAQP